MSPLGRLAALRVGRPDPMGSIPATRFEEKPKRILIAPVNYSGQGRAWAEALELADSSISARNMAVEVPGGFSFDTDLEVPVGTYHNDHDWQQRQFLSASTATHVLIEAEEPPFGRLMGRSVDAQARALIEKGVNVAYIAHGTDVRLPSRHIELNPYSYYSDPKIYLPRAEKVAARNIDLVENSGRVAFVSTPDLLLDLPRAYWCPVVVKPQRWAAARGPREPNSPLRVFHAPSVSAYKGTSLILDTLERLNAENVIEFTIVQGVPSAEMPGVFAQADVVLDQFRTGSYGVAACEALAAGCVVLGQISTQVRTEVQRATGLNVPIINATPGSLETKLRKLSATPDLDALRERSFNFVSRVHDGRLSAKTLIEHWIGGPLIS